MRMSPGRDVGGSPGPAIDVGRRIQYRDRGGGVDMYIGEASTAKPARSSMPRKKTHD
jgi:hypothetical protein